MLLNLMILNLMKNKYFAQIIF